MKIKINIIRGHNRSGRTCFRNITNWLMGGYATGRLNEDISERILNSAREVSTG